MTGTPTGDARAERLLAAVESSPSGLLMVDAQGRIVLVNHEVERLFGYSREELLGRAVEILVPEARLDAHAGLRDAFLRAPATRAMGAGRDLCGRRKDGTEVPVEIGLNPLSTEEGTFILASVVDITARKAAEKERTRLEEELRRAQGIELIGTLTSGIAHDFNNVLGAIMGYGEIALTESDSALVHEELSALLDAVERGRDVVQRILGFGRGGERTLARTSLESVAKDTVRMIRAAIPATVDVRLSVHPETPDVLADVTAVHQILLNLAANAAYAMPEGGVLELVMEPLYLHDSAAREFPDLDEGMYARLLVRDEGAGVPPEVKERVFDPFFTTKGTGSGSGLGLAMVSRLMEAHGGGVRLDSELGQGTTVECLFPGLESHVAEEATATAAAAPRGDGQRVLYVDDRPELAKVGGRQLEWLGYEVVVETDPGRALERFRAAPADFDVVVTDYTMPGMTGLALAERMREVRPGILVVMLTGYVDRLPAERFREAGVSVVLGKPVTMVELGQAVYGLLHPGQGSPLRRDAPSP